MGKSYSKWLYRLLRRKKPTSAEDPPRRSFSDNHATADPNKHAIAVANATAAVAEAALAAAKAAAEVVRLTSRPGSVAAACRGDVSKRSWSVEDYLAAVRIQSAFRGYLARRALRALKGLVKLQALVRGHFVRKRSADMLKRMQAMVRVQARARANRLQHVETINHGSERNRKLDHQRRVCSMKLNEASLLKRSGSVSSTRDANIHTSRANPIGSDCLRTGSHNSLSRTAHMDDEKADKILEIDSWRPHLAPIISRNYPSCKVSAKDYYAYEPHHHSFAASDTYPKYSTNHSLHSRSPCNSESFLSLRSLNLPPMEQDFSPQACSVPSRPGSSHSKTRAMSPYTPTRNESPRSLYGEGQQMGMYYPSYMGYTESSRAKVRSQSAPKQRVEGFESHGSTRRLYMYGNDYRVSRRNPNGDGFELGK